MGSILSDWIVRDLELVGDTFFQHEDNRTFYVGCQSVKILVSFEEAVRHFYLGLRDPLGVHCNWSWILGQD